MKITIQFNSEYPKQLVLINSLSLDLPNSGPQTLKPRFLWNGNSTPWGLWNLIPPNKFPIASAFHDDLCDKAKNNEDRKKADKDYKWILENIYHLKFRNHVGFVGVSIGRFFRRFKGYK